MPSAAASFVFLPSKCGKTSDNVSIPIVNHVLLSESIAIDSKCHIMPPMNNTPREIDQRIAKLKNHFGWNNVQLAEAAGVTKQAVGQWINEQRMPSQEAVANLKQRYKVNDLWILGKSTVMFLDDKALSDELESLLLEIQERNPERMKQVLSLLKTFVDE